MTIYIILLIVWSLLIFCLGIYTNSKLNDSYIEHLEKSRDFHKNQIDLFAEKSREIVKENNQLKERNTQLINENNKLKKELDNQSNTTYNYFVGCDIPNKDEATPPLTKN